MLLITVFLFSGTSCALAPPRSPAEEIALHSWYLSGQKVRLSFEGDEMTIRSEGSDDRIYLKGKYFTDEDKLTVLSDDCGTVIMTYRLVADKLELTYAGRTAELVKDSSFIDIQ